MDAVDALVSRWTLSHTRAEITKLAQQHGVICAPVNNLQDVLDDPHLVARGSLEHRAQEGFGQIAQLHTPIRFRDIAPPELTDPPQLGADTQSVLAELAGIDAQAIQALKDDEAI